MRRRDFIVLIGGTAAWPLPAVASLPPHVGLVTGADKTAAAEFIKALRDGLAALGYVEPSSLKLELTFADYKLERIPTLIVDLERSRVNVIVTHAAASRASVVLPLSTSSGLIQSPWVSPRIFPIHLITRRVSR